jgi:hypothetical protein
MDTIELIHIEPIHIDERQLEDWHRRVALVETLPVENKKSTYFWDYAGRFLLLHLAAYTIIGGIFLYVQSLVPKARRVALFGAVWGVAVFGSVEPIPESLEGSESTQSLSKQQYLNLLLLYVLKDQIKRQLLLSVLYSHH